MFRKLLWVLLLSSFGVAEHLHWRGNYDNALAQAKKEHKLLLVLVVKEACPVCQEILQKEFTGEASFIDTLKTKSVTVMVTYADRVYYPVELYWTNSYPTLFFVNAEKELFVHTPLYAYEITKERVEMIVKGYLQKQEVKEEQ
jgi:thioredoxin-related protein